MRPEVETRYGRLQGAQARGIRIFRGIPFARPPLGPLRFRPPHPPEPWSGTRCALGPGPVPMQLSVPGLRSIPLAGGRRQSEDCLYLNVWTPGLDGARRPVLVWIHGGGFLIGSGSTGLYDGRGLARRGDLVVVTLNYRLGALGFLHLNGVFGEAFADASNAGVGDQIAALQWVRDNIDRFGGDPGNVTVFGQSAGAMSIASLLGAPSARGLFHRVICQSGAADHVLSGEEARRVASVFLEELGGPPPHPEALARIPVARLLRAQGATNRRLMNLERLMAFLPAVDGRLIPEPPLEAVRGGAAGRVPMLVGTTLDEWKLFSVLDTGLGFLGEDSLVRRFADLLPAVAEWAPDPEQAAREYRQAVRARGGRATPFEIWSAFQSARVFHFPASQLADAQSAAGAPTYSYLFTWSPPALGRALGACHAIDVPFVFGLVHHPIARPLTGLAASAGSLARRMQRSWIEFARNGDPGHPGLPAWDRYAPDSRHAMVLDRRCRLVDGPLESERSLWERWTGSLGASPAREADAAPGSVGSSLRARRKQTQARASPA